MKREICAAVIAQVALELDSKMITEIARELILEDHGPEYDQELFSKVMLHITGPDGTRNAFDAPILYNMIQLTQV